jgi:uncharacterized lipoprotein YajG
MRVQRTLNEDRALCIHQPLERRATMRKVLISLAAAAATFAVAAPASAQVYGAPYGNAYGYNNYGYNNVRSLQVRINQIQQQINMLDRRNVLSNREARRLRWESSKVEQQLYRASRYGLNPYEARNIQIRVANLERSVRREAYDRNGRYGGRQWYGRDRDHHDRWDRDDRWGHRR